MEFSAPTAAWFERAFPGPTPIQEEGWKAIGRGEHTLLLAPTGSGKTLAAFLWSVDRLLTSPPGDGCRVLYISPLRALAYDVARNLQDPLAGIAREADRLDVLLPRITVGSRTGDTTPTERRRLARRPPDILITTPESLYLMLTSQAAATLRTVEHVIVDEIHSVAATKRGAHLALSLERLEDITARAPQRIGLSATQRPLEEIARFLGGCKLDGGPRPVTTVDAGAGKALDLRVVVPASQTSGSQMSGSTASGSRASGSRASGSSAWPELYPELLELVRTHRSTLIFVNSRRLAERLAARLNELAASDTTWTDGATGYIGSGAPAELVRAHHGSIAREQRLELEEALKNGTVPALVATSSLELGIDMGAVDLVVQVEAPVSVASGLQRVGRAGHRVGEASKGRIYPKFRHDLLVAAAIAERMRAGLVEETVVAQHPLDVLAQQIVATVAAAGAPVAVDSLARMARRAYPYADLPDSSFEGVLDMLSGRYPSDEYADLRPRLVWDRKASTVQPRPGAQLLAVTSGGTIPDRGLFGVFTADGARVGELDEEMVYESRVGDTFLLGATTWRVEEITRDRVVVAPAPGLPGRMPFWHGDSPGRPYELGAAVGRFTRTLAERSDEELAAACGLEPHAARNLRAYVEEERQATGGLVPSDQQVVVERFRDELGDWRVTVLSPFGSRVHAPWALAMETLFDRGLGLDRGVAQGAQALWSDDGIILRLPETAEGPAIEAVQIDPADVEEMVVEALGRSAMFAGRFRENAARALLLPRRRPGRRTPLWQMRQRAADLLAVAGRHGSFPILLETYRECLRDVFDLPALRQVLAQMRSGEIAVTEVEVPAPSPFASGLVFAYVAQFMYEGDAPLAERRAQALTLDRGLLAELLGTDELRDLIDVDVVEEMEAELQGLAPGRATTDVEGVADLIRRLGDLSRPELARRCSPPPLAATGWTTLVESGRAVEVVVAGESRLVLVEDAARYRDGLGAEIPAALPGSLSDPVADARLQLVRRWARTHGPFTVAQTEAHFGVPVKAVLDRLVEMGVLVKGGFRPGGEGGEEWCDNEVLRQLRQRSLAALRREVEPVAAEALARFLPAWHGVGPSGGPVRGGADRLLEVVGQLEGLPLSVPVLERDILTVRVRDYEPRLLDDLMTAGEVMWVGAGWSGRDGGRVVLARRDRAGSVLPRLGYGGPDASAFSDRSTIGGEIHDHIRVTLSERGACFFRELGRVAWSDQDVLAALWELAWAGEVTCDGFAAVRAAAAGRRSPRAGPLLGGGPGRRYRPRPGGVRQSGPAAGQGRWSLVARELATESPGGSRAAAEAATAVAGVLLDRYGVLTRDAVRAEAVPGGFAGLYPVLRAMEESGRIRRGYFLAGMGGAQFAVPGAVDQLRAIDQLRARTATIEAATTTGATVTVMMAASDPANPYGTLLPWPVAGPTRQPGAYVVMVDGLARAYLDKGSRGLVALAEADGTWEDAVAGALAALVSAGRVRRMVLPRYPPEMAEALAAAGFIPGPKGLVRYS